MKFFCLISASASLKNTDNCLAAGAAGVGVSAFAAASNFPNSNPFNLDLAEFELLCWPRKFEVPSLPQIAVILEDPPGCESTQLLKS